MSIIKGQNARLFIDDGSGTLKPFARAVGCQVEINNSVEETSTKDDTNDWAENEIVGRSWNASCDTLVGLDDPGSGGELIPALLSAALAGTKVQIKFDITNGTNNRTATNSVIKMTGYAYMDNFSIDAANRTSVKGNFHFVGTGGLTTS